MMLGLLSDTAMSSIRPPMLAGPIDRNRKLCRSGLLDSLISGPLRRACPPRPCASNRTPTAASVIAAIPMVISRKLKDLKGIAARSLSPRIDRVKANTPANRDFSAAYDHDCDAAYRHGGIDVGKCEC